MEPDPAPPLKGAKAANPLIVLIGENGLHKRWLIQRALAAFETQLRGVPTITNRAPRHDDLDEEFVHHADFTIADMEARGEFIEWTRREDPVRTFYGRTLDLIVSALRECIGIAVMGDEGAMRLVASKTVVCYIVRIVTEDDPVQEPPTLAPAGLRISHEIRCSQDEAGFQVALQALEDLLTRITMGVRSTRPPPPSRPPDSLKL